MSAPKKEKKETAVKDAKGVVAAAGAADGAPSSGGLKSKLLVGVFVSGIIIAETLVFFFMVPSGEEVAALAESRLIAVAQEIDSKKKQEHEEDTEKIVEFEMGTHSVSMIPVGADQPYRVEFQLFGTVHLKDKERLQALYDERLNRFRHRMKLEIRNASLQELQENQLGLIQRRVLATSTEILGEAILLSVGFSEYQVLEE
jgi:succinate dehydrogenase/fumarate reductase flavoprotein subunit